MAESSISLAPLRGLKKIVPMDKNGGCEAVFNVTATMLPTQESQDALVAAVRKEFETRGVVPKDILVDGDYGNVDTLIATFRKTANHDDIATAASAIMSVASSARADAKAARSKGARENQR